MRIILASTFVPFVNGGARFIVEWLEEKLLDEGHQVERFYLPFLETPEDLLDQVSALRLIDVSDACDLLIAFRPPAYVLRHPNKVLWFIHHIRSYYDLWDGEYGPAKTPINKAVRESLKSLDDVSLREARKVFTNSQVVADRLLAFNNVQAEPLYPPIRAPERFHCRSYGDELVAVCRMEPHKRQDVLIEALKHTRTPVKLRLCGKTSGEGFAGQLKAAAHDPKLKGRLVLDDRWISEDEKAELMAEALAAVYAPHDEDSYGYPSLEAAHAAKCVVTTTDSGGVLELIQDGRNGLVCAPDALSLARAFDRLYMDRALARRLGEANRDRLGELGIHWERVVSALTS